MNTDLIRKLMVMTASVVLALSMCVSATAAEPDTDPGFATPAYDEMYAYGSGSSSIPVEGRLVPDKTEGEAPPPGGETPGGETPGGETLEGGVDPGGGTLEGGVDPGGGGTPGGPGGGETTGGDTGGGNAGGTGDGAGATEEGAPVEEEENVDLAASAVPAATGDSTDIGEDQSPLSGGRSGSWSLLSMLFSVIALLIAAALLVRAITRRREEDDRYARSASGGEGDLAARYAREDDSSGRSTRGHRRGAPLITLSIILGVITPIVWLWLDDLKRPMEFINGWTPLIGALLAIQLLACLLYAWANRRETALH